jgi:DNA-binding Xre family transcriptional regulator
VQISRIERGVREVRLTTLLRLGVALELTPAELLAGLY